MIKLNSATLAFEPQQTFKVNHTATVLELKQLLSESFNFDINQTLIVKYGQLVVGSEKFFVDAFLPGSHRMVLLRI